MYTPIVEPRDQAPRNTRYAVAVVLGIAAVTGVSFAVTGRSPAPEAQLAVESSSSSSTMPKVHAYVDAL